MFKTQLLLVLNMKISSTIIATIPKIGTTKSLVLALGPVSKVLPVNMLSLFNVDRTVSATIF